jgi:CRP-like cAMP-binding protein
MTTDADLKAIRTRYETAVANAETERANAIRAALADGRTQTDVCNHTGYTRETVRRILKPEAAEAVREARRRRYKEHSDRPAGSEETSG